MGLLALISLLLVYNNFLNLWPPFNDRLYVPVNLLFTAVLLGIGVWGFGLSATDVGGPGPAGPALGAGAALGALVTAPLFVALTSERTARRIADRRLEGLDTKGAAYQIAVRVPVGTALLEEVAFRGVLFAALQHLGDLQAAVWSSVVFGLWHIGPTRNLMQANRPDAGRTATVAAIALSVGATALAGLGFVWMRLWAGTLWGPWALHASLNSLATLAAVLAHARINVRTEGVEATQ